jgi:probable HAF family extracellular repeat protein
VSAHAYAINDAGVIVGDVTYAGGSHRAFVRAATGEVTLLETPGTSSTALALNEAGQVTGTYTSGSPVDGPFHAFMWTQAGGTVDLGTLPSGAAGTESSLVPAAINESGDIIGTVYAWSAGTPGVGTPAGSFLYARTGGIRDLRTPSAMDAVTALNDAGEILGWGTLDGMHQPVTWATTRPNQLAVRFGWTYSASQGEGIERQINNWNEVLDSFMENDRLRNVVWTWDPARYR